MSAGDQALAEQIAGVSANMSAGDQELEEQISEIRENAEEQNTTSMESINRLNNIKNMNSLMPKAIAHRGVSDECPENTIESFITAGEQGFWACETDIQTTSDGVYICHHDDTVDRMTDGTGLINEMTYEQIQALNIDNGSNLDIYNFLNQKDFYEFSYKIPTLAEFLDVCLTHNMVPVIEVKNVPDVNDFYEFLLVKGVINKCIVISFNIEFLDSLRDLDPNITILALYNDFTQALIDECHDKNFGMSIPVSALNETLHNYARARHVLVNVWNILTTDNTNLCRSLNVEFMTLNSMNWYSSGATTPIGNANNIFKIFTPQEKRQIEEFGLSVSKTAMSTNSGKAYMTFANFPLLRRHFSSVAAGGTPQQKYAFRSDSRYIVPWIIPLYSGRDKIGTMPNFMLTNEWENDIQFTVHCYNNQSQFLGDIGWITSETDIPEGTSFGILYFKVPEGRICSKAIEMLIRLHYIRFVENE